MHPITEAVLARRTLLWNALILKRAARIEIHADHVRYLHPTKGWRRVANHRLGL